MRKTSAAREPARPERRLPRRHPRSASRRWDAVGAARGSSTLLQARGEQLLRPVRPLPVLLLHVTEELRQLLKGSGRRLRDVLLGMLHGPQTANGVVVIG